MPPLRVAILGWYPLIDDRVLGGVEAVIAQLAAALQQGGDVEVHVVILSRDVAEDRSVARDGLQIHAVRARSTPRWTLLRANARAIGHVLDAIAPDVVHAHGSGHFADAALSSGRPSLITLHGIIWREAEVARQQGLSWRRSLSWTYDVWYERWCLRRAQDVVAISPYVLGAYRDTTGARMHLIENPVSEAYFHLPYRPEPDTILCAARVMPRKNILGLLQAFALVRDRRPAARLRIAGETSSYPDYADQCRRFVQEQGLADAVDFLGWLGEEPMAAEFGRCACVALVSWQETASITIEQAMAAGKAVVASDVGGTGYLLAGGEAGLLVAPDDVTGTAEALTRVLADGELRNRLGRRGRAEASARFQVDAVADQTVALYRQVIREQQ